MLEGGVELSWAADDQLRGTPEERLLRILRRGYEALAEAGSLPLAEQAVLDDAVARRLKLSPGSARNAMQEMDAAEVRAGGSVYWESHYEQFRIRSGYVHTSFVGPARFRVTSDAMEIDMNPDPLEGVAALRWGLYYFVRGADAVLRVVGLNDEASEIAGRYAAVKDLADGRAHKGPRVSCAASPRARQAARSSPTSRAARDRTIPDSRSTVRQRPIAETLHVTTDQPRHGWRGFDVPVILLAWPRNPPIPRHSIAARWPN